MVFINVRTRPLFTNPVTYIYHTLLNLCNIQLLPLLLDELAEASGAEQIKQKGQTLLDYVCEWQKLQNKRVSSENQSTVQQVKL